MSSPQETPPPEDAPASAAEETSSSAETKAQPQPAPKRSKLPLFVIGLVVLIAGAVGVGLWLNFGGSPQVAREPGKPIPPELPPPPPAFKATLSVGDDPAEAGKDGAALAITTEKISSIAAQLSPELLLASVDGAAPSRLIVSGSQERPVDTISRIPRHERWEIRIPPGNTSDSYTRQLDYFKMEIGVIGQSNDIVYLSNLSAPTPASRTVSGSGEKRLYLIWQRGSMRDADEEVLARAKIPSGGKVIVHFCPEELESQLVQMEDEAAKQAGIKRIRKTVFGIRPKEPEGFRFFVIEQKADE